MMPLWVSFLACSSVTSFTSPKSSTFAKSGSRRWGQIMMFPGFRSRWTSPRSWASSRDEAICRPTWSTSTAAIGPFS